MRKILLLLLILLPQITFGAFTVPFQATSTTQGWIFPSRVSGVDQAVIAPYFRATSTTPNYFAGNLGIGTSSPSLPLSVATSSVSAYRSAYFAGNVGVGINTPSYEMDIYSMPTGDPSPGAQLNIVDGSNSFLWEVAGGSVTMKRSATPVMQWGGTNIVGFLTGGNFGSFTQDSTAHLVSTASSASSIPVMIKAAASQTADLLQLRNSANSVITTFNKDGWLGIGVTSPSQKLDVAGFINTDQFSGYKQAGNTILYASSTNFSTLTGIEAGDAILADGTYNTALGYQALTTVTSADSNTAIGAQAMAANTSGIQNVAIGHEALRFGTTGSGNVAIGMNAMGDNTNTGDNNTVVGYNSLTMNSSGAGNVAIGANLLIANTTGGSNVAIGSVVLSANVGGSSNIGMGTTVLNTLTSGTGNIGIGQVTLSSNNGNYNMAIGGQSMAANTSGEENIAMGYGSLNASTNGSNNVSLGMYSGYYNKSSASNVFVGHSAGFGVSTVTTLSQSTFLGAKSAYAITTGGQNIAIGYQSGDNLTSGAKNIIIGTDIDAPSATESNQLNIGNIIFGTGVSGTGSTIAGNIGIGSTSPYAKLSVAGSVVADYFHATSTNATTTLQDTIIGTNRILKFNAFSTVPQIYADSDDNTGIMFDGPDVMSLHTGGVERVLINAAGFVGIGTSTPTGKLSIYQSTLGNEVLRLESTASNSDPVERTFQGKTTTTNATATTILTVAIPTTTTVGLDITVVARRTGGAAGTAEDGGFFKVYSQYNNIAGIATIIGSDGVINSQSNTGTYAVSTVSDGAGNALVQVAGDLDTNVSWSATVRTYQVTQ